MKTLSLLALFLGMIANTAQAQWAGLIDPNYGGTTQYSEWDLFTTATNALPDIAGSIGSITETTGNGFSSSTLNIYSYAGDTEYSMVADSTNVLGQVSFQIVSWGVSEPYIGDTTLSITDSNGNIVQTLIATSSTVFLNAVIEHPDYGLTEYYGIQYTWDLNDYSTTSYEINFSHEVHTSLVLARLDTTTVFLESEPGVEVILVQVETSFDASGDISLNFQTYNDNYYQVKWTDDLSDGEISGWNNLGVKMTGDGTVQSVIDTDSSEHPTRFYSIVITDS